MKRRPEDGVQHRHKQSGQIQNKSLCRSASPTGGVAEVGQVRARGQLKTFGIPFRTVKGGAFSQFHPLRDSVGESQSFLLVKK